jgi:hypothetical protein
LFLSFYISFRMNIFKMPEQIRSILRSAVEN